MKENSRMMNGIDKNDGGNDRVHIEMNKMDHELDILWRRRLYAFIGRVTLFYSIPLYATIQLLIEWLPLYLIYIWTTTIDRLISTAIWHVVHCARNCLNPLLKWCMRLSELIVRVTQFIDSIHFDTGDYLNWLLDWRNNHSLDLLWCTNYIQFMVVNQLWFNILEARIGLIIVWY